MQIRFTPLSHHEVLQAKALLQHPAQKRSPFQPYERKPSTQLNAALPLASKLQLNNISPNKIQRSAFIQPLSFQNPPLSISRSSLSEPNRRYAVTLYQQFENARQLQPGAELVNRISYKV